MKTFEVDVIQTVRVTLDESKFTPEFMQEFREGFYSFEDFHEHAEHIAQLVARGIVDLSDPDTFIEGYGEARDMGISAKILWTEMMTNVD